MKILISKFGLAATRKLLAERNKLEALDQYLKTLTAEELADLV